MEGKEKEEGESDCYPEYSHNLVRMLYRKILSAGLEGRRCM